MTFRQFLERGTQFSLTGFGNVAGRLGESPYKAAKPQILPPKIIPELPKTDGTRKQHEKRIKSPIKAKSVRVKGVV